MQKLDAHQHFWQLARVNYPWLTPELTPIYRNFEPSDLAPELEVCGVSGSVIVQATHALAETEWHLSLSNEVDFVKGVVGWVDLRAPDVSEQLQRLKSLGKLCGIRHQVHDEPAIDWLLQTEIISGLKQVANGDLVYDLLVRPPHLKLLPELFEQVPQMYWVIDHLAKPEIKAQRFDDWAQAMAKVAAFPNVYCKVSGMITEADHANWTIEDIKPYFEQVLELFGADRLLYGSDYPVCLLAGDYQQVHDLVAVLLSSLSADEQAAIWGQTALKIYKIKH
jgi:L-fuconolactonase